MKNDIYKYNFFKLSSVTLLPIPWYIYLPSMGALSKTMPREWSYLIRLSWNLYMFVDDRTFCEIFFCKLWQKSSLPFFLSTSTHKRTPCQRISFLRFSSFSLTFFWKNGPNDRHGYSLKEVDFSKTLDGSLM